MIHWAKKLMGDEEAVQEREPHFSPPGGGRSDGAGLLQRGSRPQASPRRPIIRRTLLMAGGALGLIGVVPMLNLGPMSGRKPKALGETSWRLTKATTDVSGKPIKGIRMIDQTGPPDQAG